MLKINCVTKVVKLMIVMIVISSISSVCISNPVKLPNKYEASLDISYESSERPLYQYWDARCDGTGHEGPEARPTEVWYIELQNGAAMGRSSVMCYCNSTKWDWTFIKHITWNGQTCTCGPGETPHVQIDHDTCEYGQLAVGFFYLQQPS